MVNSTRCMYMNLLLGAALATACGDDSGNATETASGTASSTDASASTTTPTTASGSGSTTNPSGTDSESAGTTTSATEPDTTAGPTSSTTAETTTGISGTDPGTSDPTTGEVTTDGTVGTTGTTSETTSTTDDTTGTTGEEPCGCADIEVPLDDGIFVLSDDAELWKYRPDDNSFEMLGPIGCNMPNTFSMGVDRLGFAWVMFNPPSGEIRMVDVTNPADCSDPGYNPGQLGVELFGMAFVSNDAVDQCDKLYGNTYNGFGGFMEGNNIGDFLVVDPDTLQLQTLGKTSFNGAELTGTGDGRVFMFGGVNPAKLVEVDKTNGDYIDVLPLGNLALTNAFAFAFFAGDFYFFTESNNPGVSKVTHLDYDDSDNNGMQDLTTVNPQGPIRIVGAGVSTCAPYLPM